LEGFFSRQVTRWLAEKLGTAKEFLKIKRKQIVSELPQECHNILLSYHLSTFGSVAYAGCARAGATRRICQPEGKRYMIRAT
jgi:hypothetical protein